MNTENMFSHINSPDGKTYTLEVNPKWLAQEPDRRERDRARIELAKVNNTFRKMSWSWPKR